jgi:class 3 adenylate cyclase/tetratricopeptide (TPR) repeat protein
VRAGQNFCSQCGKQSKPVRAGGRRVRTPQYLAERMFSVGQSSVSENKIATVLFADVAGSTALIRDLNAEDADRILGPSVEIMATVVHRYEGAVREEGDGIMATFGAPIAHEDHAVRACNAALEIQEAIRRHAAEVRRDFGLLLQVRIGVNSGPVVVRVVSQEGDFIDLRMQGAPINIASRLEKLAAPGTILLARETLALAEGFIRTGPIETVTVKGIEDRLEVCELHGVNTRMRIHARAARGLSRFVGREDEIKHLARAAAQAQSGRGQVVALVGEPGIGKSRLFLEFARSSYMQGWLVLAASSVSYGRATSYLPLVDLLSRYFEIEVRSDEQRIREKVVRKLSALGEPRLLAQAPVFFGTLGMGANEDAWMNLTPSERQANMFDALRHLLIREAQIQPLALVFEDLHWIDPETQTFLDALVESIPAARVLMLVNYRPEYGLRWAGKGHFSQIRIDPLMPASADELLEVLLGSHAELQPVKQELIRVTEGNPLFLEESVRNLIEKGVLSSRAGQWHQVRDLPDRDRVPPRIDALVAERIDRLQPHLKQTLQCAAVIGNDIPHALLEAVNDLKGPGLERAVRELQVAEFLYEKTLFPETEYSFKHSMTREVAYQHLMSDRRIELHARAARALESLAAGRLEEHVERLADHAEKGRLWDKALAYLRRSGEKAYSLYANEQAARFFRQALEALARLPDSQARLEHAVDLRFELRNALLGLGATDEILRCLEEVKPLLDALGDRRRKARYAAFRCNYHFLAAEQRDAIKIGDEGLDDARDCGDRLVEGELLYRVGQSYLALGQSRTAIARLEDSLRIIDEHDRGRYDLVVLPAVVARTWLVHALAECGEFAEGISRAAEAVKIAENEHPPSVALGWLATGHLLLRKGEFLGAVNALKVALGLCDKYKWSLRVWRPRLASTLGVAYARSGESVIGLEMARQAVDDAAQMRLKYDQPLLLVRLGQASLIAGRVFDAQNCGEEATRIAQDRGAKGDEAWARFLIARACWVKDPQDLEKSARELESALGLARDCEARPLTAYCQTMLAAVLGRRGNHEAARKFAAAADAAYKELGMQPLPLDPVK